MNTRCRHFSPFSVRSEGAVSALRGFHKVRFENLSDDDLNCRMTPNADTKARIQKPAPAITQPPKMTMNIKIRLSRKTRIWVQTLPS